MKKENRGIRLTLDVNGKTYGTDLQGHYFELCVSPRKIKGTVDDWELVKNWEKLHPSSWLKFNIIVKFNHLIRGKEEEENEWKSSKG